MPMKRLLGHSIVATGGLMLAASPAWAHLDPVEHGGFAGAPDHAFGIDHVLATIGLVAIIVGISFAVWRSKRNAAASAVTERRRQK